MTPEELEVLFQTRLLISMGVEVFPTSGFLQRTFFSHVIEDDSEHIDIILKSGSKILAPFVSPRIGGKVMSGIKKSTQTYKPAYIKQKFPTDATDVLSQTNRPIYANDETVLDRVAEKLSDEIAEGDANIDRRVEWMASQVLQTGKCPIKGDGVDEVIDCLFSASQTKTLSGTGLWNDPASSPMKTFRDIRKERTDAGGKAPNVIVMGVDAYQAYISHPETLDMFDKRRIDRGSLKPELIEENVIMVGYIPELATTIYVYDETYTDENGDTQYYVNPKGFIYGSTKAEGKVVYGAIKDLKALYATKVFIKSWEEEDPSVRWLLMQSAPVVIPTYKDSFAYCEVL